MRVPHDADTTAIEALPYPARGTVEGWRPSTTPIADFRPCNRAHTIRHLLPQQPRTGARNRLRRRSYCPSRPRSFARDTTSSAQRSSFSRRVCQPPCTACGSNAPAPTSGVRSCGSTNWATGAGDTRRHRRVGDLAAHRRDQGARRHRPRTGVHRGRRVAQPRGLLDAARTVATKRLAPATPACRRTGASVDSDLS